MITVHAPNGIWNSNQGYEFNLVMAAAVFALAGIGPGNWSLDSAFGFDLHSTVWAIGALVVGVLGGSGRFSTAGSLLDTSLTRPRRISGS